MINFYIKTVDLDGLKKDLRFYGLCILTITIWGLAALLYSTIFIEDSSLLVDVSSMFMILYSIAYLGFTFLILCKIAGCLFYLGKEGDSNDKVYL